jgi:uncharacterized phage protein (TIGR01671 family)
MRDIEFRGKRSNGGEWTYGDYIRAGGYVYIFPFGDLEPDGHHVQQAEDGPHWVDPETVGQYTGMIDCNRKRIFEGDIIKCQKRIYVIKWIDDLCVFEMCHKDNNFRLSLGCFSDKEIIGNIHDTPELLSRE